MQITHANITDLAQLMLIEQAEFTTAEAASEEAMLERIKTIPDTFLVSRDKDGNVTGFIMGPVINQRYLTDDLFEHVTENSVAGGFQSVLSLAVSPDYRGQGIAGQLLNELADVAKKAKRKAVTLTCLDRLVAFYEQHGYTDEGISSSNHGGETWHNMVLGI